jgi:ketosteroid isomerase-like protein
MRAIPALLFSLLVVVATNVLAAGNAADTQARSELLSVFQGWTAAYEKGDLDGTMRIFAPDLVFAFQGGKDQTFDDLRQDYVGDFATRAPGTTWVPHIEEVYVEGSVGFVRSIWEWKVKSETGETQLKARNHSVDILSKSSGTWHIVRSFNYPEKWAPVRMSASRSS